MTTHQEAHVTDANIIALLGDDVVAERGSMEAHLAECAGCAARAAMIRNRWNGFAGLLADTESLISPERLPGTLAEVLRRRKIHRYQTQLRWAAGIILLVGIAVATPVRAWITSWVTQHWSTAAAPAPANDLGPAPAAESVSTPPVQARHGLQFRPAGDQFTLVFDVPQRHGTLTVAVGESPDAYIEVVGPAESDAMVVFPTRLQVRNSPGSAASYKLTLSPNVQTLRVQIRGESATEIATRQLVSNPSTFQLHRLEAAEAN